MKSFDPGKAADGLDADTANIAEALRWSQRHEPELALRLALAMTQGWERKNEWGKAYQSLSDSIDASWGAKPGLRAKALKAFGEFGLGLGKYAEAESRFRQAADIARTLGARRLEAACQCALGGALAEQAKFSEAEESLVLCLRLSRDRSGGAEYTHAVACLGRCHYLQGNLAAAKMFLGRSVSLLSAEGPNVAYIRALSDLGGVLRAEGNGSDSRAFLELALETRHPARPNSVWYPLQEIARLESTEGRPIIAARIAGFLNAMWESAEVPLPPVEGPRLQWLTFRLSDTLGPDVFEVEAGIGGAMGLDDLLLAKG